MRLKVLVVVSVLAVILGGCVTPPAASSPQGSGQGTAAAKIQAVDAWARAGAAEMGNGAAYMILRNSGDAADRLVKAESDVAGAVELHKSSMEGGMMKMAPVENIEVPAKGQAEAQAGRSACDADRAEARAQGRREDQAQVAVREGGDAGDRGGGAQTVTRVASPTLSLLSTAV